MAMITDKQALAIGVAAIVGAGLMYWQYRRIAGGAEEVITSVKDVAGDVVTAINPASTENILYSGISKAGAAMTGDNDWNLGGAIYDGVDWVRGIWGDSDSDRLEELESEYQRQRAAGVYETVGVLANKRTTIINGG